MIDIIDTTTKRALRDMAARSPFSYEDLRWCYLDLISLQEVDAACDVSMRMNVSIAVAADMIREKRLG